MSHWHNYVTARTQTFVNPANGAWLTMFSSSISEIVSTAIFIPTSTGRSEKKKKIWRSSRARSEAPAWRIKYVTKSPVRNFFPFISQRRRSVPVYNNKRDTNSIIFFDNRKWRVRHTLYYVSFIRHLHISHNAPYLPITRQISHNRFSFPLGITAVPREFENDAYAKFCGGKYGVLWGMYKWRIVQNSPYPRSKNSHF